MARPSRKHKDSKKPPNGTKFRHPKRSKFSVHNRDVVYRPIHPPSGSGRPTNYIYGNEATNVRKARKLDRGKKKSNAKNFAARKRGKRPFILRLPVVGPKTAKTTMVPWLRGKQPAGKESKKSSTGRKKDRKLILNGAFAVNESTMNFFESEMESFSDYVRLSRTEIKAREHLIDQIKKSCKSLFGVEDSQCQVFGSFVAQPVCIFESDIDLAIWGVVEPDEDERDDEDDEDDEESRNERFAQTQDLIAEGDQNDKIRRKQERIQKWKALIDDAANNLPEGVNSSAESSAAADSIAEAKGESDNDGSPLFILDRIGDASLSSSDDRGVCPVEDITIKSSGIDGGHNDCSNDEHCNDIDDNSINSDCNSESDNSVDDDNADKLENFWSRRGKENHASNDGIDTGIDTKNTVENSYTGKAVKGHDDDGGNDDTENDEEVMFNDIGIRRRPRGQSLVSLSSSTTCSVEAKLDESEMEVSFVVDGSKQAAKEKVGPSGRTRTLVVKSLFKLSKPLRSFSSQIHVRSKARVPIINMITNFGFECDIALGGHNGTDTSSYASIQLSRFKSFSTLVVFLKVLLGQQGLDKPFTGGLGSYCLYVLVASHLEQHIELGGDDNPAEALYTFFFRYGAVQHSNPKTPQSFRTLLSQESVIQTTDGGSIDMKPCFQIENCITVFEACWKILERKLSRNSDGKFSILQFMIDAMKLEIGRSQKKKQADIRASKPPCHIARRSHGAYREEKKEAEVDNEARALILGYGEKVETFLPAPESPKKRAAAKKSKKKKKQKTSF